MTLIHWPDLAQQPIIPLPFLIDPYIPEQGVVLLHGKPSLGKSPLSWLIASCVATGQPFFGCPTKAGKVLYVEADTPQILVRKRLAPLEPATNVWWFFCGEFDILKPQLRTVQELTMASREVSPTLVIINTLRKVHVGKDVESDVPSRVYGNFRALFPGAALLFIHHDRKDILTQPGAHDTAEDFSGSAAWRNDAQVVLHLRKSGGEPGVVRLDHTKSQVSELVEPLMLRVSGDEGERVESVADARAEEFRAAWEATTGTRGQRVVEVMAALRMSRRTVFRRLKELSTVPNGSEAVGTDLNA